MADKSDDAFDLGASTAHARDARRAGAKRASKYSSKRLRSGEARSLRQTALRADAGGGRATRECAVGGAGRARLPGVQDPPKRGPFGQCGPPVGRRKPPRQGARAAPTGGLRAGRRGPAGQGRRPARHAAVDMSRLGNCFTGGTVAVSLVRQFRAKLLHWRGSPVPLLFLLLLSCYFSIIYMWIGRRPSTWS